MSTERGREIWSLAPPGPNDVIAIDDDEPFVRLIPGIFERMQPSQNGRIFCFTDPDHALTLIDQLAYVAKPRLFLVDMMFSSEKRGPEIIDQIRRSNWRAAVVGYSAYAVETAKTGLPTTIDAVLANEVGADEWFNKRHLVDDDFEVDLQLFFGCVVRALERRETVVREIEQRFIGVKEQIEEWSQALIADEKAQSGRLSEKDIRARLPRLNSILTPFRKTSHNTHNFLLSPEPALQPTSGDAAGGQAKSYPSEFLQLWDKVEHLIADSGNILTAHRSGEIEKLAKLVADKFDQAVSQVGYPRFVDFAQARVGTWGRDARSDLVRTFAHLCRQWAESRKDALNTADASRVVALVTFLKAAQGQAAAELGFDYEAYDYLTTAVSEASLYDIAHVREFARRRLAALAAQKLPDVSE